MNDQIAEIRAEVNACGSVTLRREGTRFLLLFDSSTSRYALLHVGGLGTKPLRNGPSFENVIGPYRRNLVIDETVPSVEECPF